MPRARGTARNDTPRFEPHQRSVMDDGWGGDHLHDPSIVTETRLESARSIISYNRSPDLPFDRSINPYRGCEHGCIYCFARPSHAYLGLSPGLDFETRLIARPNAPERLRHELSAPAYAVAPMAIGTNTDPYQPIERDHKITRACLEVLRETQHPVAIVTKGALIERDIDILADMAAHGLARVGVSVTTLDPDLCRKMEPRAPSPARRLKMIERLSDVGIEVRVMASPMVPALTDPELEAILQAGADAGARHASWIMLRLPRAGGRRGPTRRWRRSCRPGPMPVHTRPVGSCCGCRARCRSFGRIGLKRICRIGPGASWRVCARCTGARTMMRNGGIGCAAAGITPTWCR